MLQVDSSQLQNDTEPTMWGKIFHQADISAGARRIDLGKSSWSKDDNRLMEFLTIHMLLTPLMLVLVLLYQIIPPFTVVNTLVSRHDKSFVVHLLEPAIKQCMKEPLSNFEDQYK